MRQRAKRVDLKPEIEEACVRDLGMYCSDSEKYKPEQVSNLVMRLGHVLFRIGKI